MAVARRMYAWRLGEVLPHRDIAVLRGIEGARVKETYRLTAERIGIRWIGRLYDRQDPLAADLPNQALNHAASAVEAAAAIQWPRPPLYPNWVSSMRIPARVSFSTSPTSSGTR
jgi:CRISP-associated protein Cas1